MFSLSISFCNKSIIVIFRRIYLIFGTLNINKKTNMALENINKQSYMMSGIPYLKNNLTLI